MKLVCSRCKTPIEVNFESTERVGCPVCDEKNRIASQKSWLKRKKKQKNIKSPLNEKKEDE